MKLASLFRRAVSAVFVVFLHYVPQITLYMDDSERYFGRWGLDNIARIALGTLLLAAAALTADELLRRRAPAWAGLLFRHLFLVALLSGLLAAFPAYTADHAGLVAATWCAGLALIAASFFWRRSPLVHYAAIFCLIFSPLAPILFGEMLLWPRWKETLDPLPQTADKEAPGPPVFLFVFDEWSWPRSSRDGQFTSAFPHLQALAREATVYRNALSPFRETVQSLSRFIFQTDDEFTIHDGQTWFAADGKETPTRQARSLLTLAREHRYHTCLLGFHHAYRHMLDGQVAVCRSYFAGDEAGPAEQLCDELLENSRSWTDPLSRRWLAPLADQLDVKNWRAMVHRYRDDMFRLLEECPRRSFVVCHVPVPHAPFVFNADGSDRAADASVDDLEGYRLHLGYADTLVGQIVDILQRTGKYDDSLIVITSDHSWRFDPDPADRQGPDWQLRIPLVIKTPGQKLPAVVDGPVSTNRLMQLLEPALAK